MSTEENSRKRKNQNVEEEGVKRQDIEMTEFTKYVKLVPELRHHILTYSTGSTLCNYSQCSKICNKEIQRFNTVLPDYLKITENGDGVVVKLSYRINKKLKYVEKKFVFSEVENTMDEIQKHILKYFKYVKNGTYLSSVCVDVRHWPMDLMRMEHIANADECVITIYKSMYEDCMEYLKNRSSQDLDLRNCAEVADQVTIPAEFFKSAVFQRLNSAQFFMNCKIDSEDFINLKKEHVLLTASISFDDIRAKVNKWNRESHSKSCFVAIKLPEDDDREWDLDEVFPSEQFDVVPFVDGGGYKYYGKWSIGKVDAVFRRDGDRILRLEFNEDEE